MTPAFIQPPLFFCACACGAGSDMSRSSVTGKVCRRRICEGRRRREEELAPWRSGFAKNPSLLQPQKPLVGVEAAGERLVAEVVRAGVPGERLAGDRDEHLVGVQLAGELGVAVTQDRPPPDPRRVA